MWVTDCEHGYGPSPRGRGRQVPIGSQAPVLRTIPAWAGETEILCPVCNGLRDHPRVGGGDSAPASARNASMGPSPRGRGRLVPVPNVAQHVRTIPAWAGETSASTPTKTGTRDHPRVGGGDRLCPLLLRLLAGPSPRGRGRPVRGDSALVWMGTIPAWAGETFSSASRAARFKDHPRVGGGDTETRLRRRWPPGPSPRGRGRRQSLVESQGALRTIPAWAGETLNTHRT